jgi:PKD repeat protein
VQYEHIVIGNDTTAIINLSKEGYTIDIDKDGDNNIDYTVDPTTVETNHPPEVSIMAIADDEIFKDDISIRYTLKDIDNDVCNISARYSTDQMIWHDATIGSGGDGTIGLSSSADGVTHTYVWASGVDLPDVSSVVYFEIRPNDGMTDGIRGMSNAFYVGEVTASFTYSPLNPSVDENIVFAAYASIGNITNYAWDFDDGTITGTDAPIIMHSYTSAGEYSVILTITDKEGATNAISRVVPVASQGGNDFDTGFGSYPSVMGTHTGTITPNQDINVSKLYTYPCAGTGGHTESVRIYGNEIDKSASWNGYAEDRDTITFDSPFTLESGKTYNYVIETGSYPQIHHTDNLSTPAGFITCSEFRDVNGKRYSNWIPAIRLT